MGRPPCCDKIGVKKGPWTPEEDITLVSYIQEHGPGNWRSVPTNTGLLRCSKSCRLRWTNYLRPGIKRGNFTEQEEKTIIHLQALFGNRWAAIASFLPRRTDNDIKNYWNTHLRKKLKKGQNQDGVSYCQSVPKGQWERRIQTDIRMAKQALSEALSHRKQNPSTDSNDFNDLLNSAQPHQPPTYASNADNISRLLQNWMKNTPKPASATAATNSAETMTPSSFNSSDEGALSDKGLDSFFSFNSCSTCSDNNVSHESENSVVFQVDSKPNMGDQMPLTLIEKWLLDDVLF